MPRKRKPSIVGQPEPRPAATRQLRRQVTLLRLRMWQAERIGWPLLAETFRRELVALGVEA